MTRSAARRIAESGRVTYGDLRRAITAGMVGQGGQSRVNPSLTKAQAADILLRGIARRADAELVDHNRGNVLTAVNIIREFPAQFTEPA